jgi:hypothetical protein
MHAQAMPAVLPAAQRSAIKRLKNARYFASATVTTVVPSLNNLINHYETLTLPEKATRYGETFDLFGCRYL